jgi:hypothetical protein
MDGGRGQPKGCPLRLGNLTLKMSNNIFRGVTVHFDILHDFD